MLDDSRIITGEVLEDAYDISHHTLKMAKRLKEMHSHLSDELCMQLACHAIQGALIEQLNALIQLNFID